MIAKTSARAKVFKAKAKATSSMLNAKELSSRKHHWFKVRVRVIGLGLWLRLGLTVSDSNRVTRSSANAEGPREHAVS